MHFFIFLKKTKHTQQTKSVELRESVGECVWSVPRRTDSHRTDAPLTRFSSFFAHFFFGLVWFSSSNTWHRHIFDTQRWSWWKNYYDRGVALVWTGAQWTLSETPLWWWHVYNDGLTFAFKTKWHYSYVMSLVTTLYVPNMNSWEKWYIYVNEIVH